MISWLLAGLAHAADLSTFAGVWGLDPSRSDDPSTMIDRALAPPTVGASPAARMSPDGQGEQDGDEVRRKLVGSVNRMLSVSGTLELTPSATGLTLSYGGEDSVALTPGGGWTKLKREDGTWKIRLREDGDRLRIERRTGSTWVVETLLPRADDGALVVVVLVDGSGLEPGVEFRRVYRPLETP